MTKPMREKNVRIVTSSSSARRTDFARNRTAQAWRPRRDPTGKRERSRERHHGGGAVALELKGASRGVALMRDRDVVLAEVSAEREIAARIGGTLCARAPLLQH